MGDLLKLSVLSLKADYNGISIGVCECSGPSACVDFPGGSDGKASVYNAGDLGSIPGWGRSPGEGNGNPLQYSCLERPMG